MVRIYTTPNSIEYPLICPYDVICHKEQDTCELLFMDGNCSVIVHDQGETVDMDFIMRDRIERTITGINKAELCSVVNEALESLDIPHLKQ